LSDATRTSSAARTTKSSAGIAGAGHESSRAQVPLYGKGLEAYRAHEVRNSRWLAAEQATNSVHRGYNAASWQDTKHYLLMFHDDCFECLAKGYKVEVVNCSFREAVNRVVERLFEE
jgi:hypothetical protein